MSFFSSLVGGSGVGKTSTMLRILKTPEITGGVYDRIYYCFNIVTPAVRQMEEAAPGKVVLIDSFPRTLLSAMSDTFRADRKECIIVWKAWAHCNLWSITVPYESGTVLICKLKLCAGVSNVNLNYFLMICQQSVAILSSTLLSSPVVVIIWVCGPCAYHAPSHQMCF